MNRRDFVGSCVALASVSPCAAGRDVMTCPESELLASDVLWFGWNEHGTQAVFDDNDLQFDGRVFRVERKRLVSEETWERIVREKLGEEKGRAFMRERLADEQRMKSPQRGMRRGHQSGNT